MSDLTLSKAIRQATVFLEQVHEDVYSLLTSLVDMLGRDGWCVAYNGRVSWDLGCKLESDWWVLPDAWLLFLPQACKDMNSDRFIAVACHFTQLEGTIHDYATFTASAIRCPNKLSADALWYDWEPHAEVYSACLGKNAFVALPLSKFTRKLRLEAKASTIMLPLSDLTEANALRTKIVEPLLAEEKKLGAKS